MKKTLIALMALAGVAYATSTDSAVDKITMEKGGNYYAAPFEFTFAITDDISGAYDIVGLYHGAGGGGTANLNCFVLNNSEGAITLSMVRATNLQGGYNFAQYVSYDLTSATEYTTKNNASSFVSGDGSATTLSKNVQYTVEYLGGDNGSAAANLYSGENLIGSFTGGSFNLAGGGDGGVNRMMWQSNEDYMTSITVSGVTYSMPTPSIPEPATATLSLLALAGLASRRRRH